MFPIPFNFPFRRKDGSISTIGNEIENGGSGSTYTLPTASADVKGGIKVGAGLTMDGDVLKNTNPTPATPYTLPTATAETLGGVKVGSGLSIDEGVLSVSGGSGGSGDKIYYKEFAIQSAANSATLADDIKIYEIAINNLNLKVTGYTPISAVLHQDHSLSSPVYAVASIRKVLSGDYLLTLITNQNLVQSNLPNFKIIVYYKPDGEIDQIPT